MEDKIIKAPLTSEEPWTLKAMANMPEEVRDFYRDKASKMFGVPYEEVTDKQRAEAKAWLWGYIYGRRNDNPLNEVD